MKPTHEQYGIVNLDGGLSEAWIAQPAHHTLASEGNNTFSLWRPNERSRKVLAQMEKHSENAQDVRRYFRRWLQRQE